jgi:hypothetical protein
VIRAPKAGSDEIARVFKAHQLGAPLNGDPKRLQPLDEQALVFVLWEDLHEGVWREARSNVLERYVRGLLAFDPQIDRRRLMAALEDLVGKVELAVEFEGPCLDRKSSRCGSGLRGLVDDASPHAQLR